jgi:hypothetical protein
VRVDFKGLTAPLQARWQMLDAATPSNDENARLRSKGTRKLTTEAAVAELDLEPYGIWFGSLEPSR